MKKVGMFLAVSIAALAALILGAYAEQKKHPGNDALAQSLIARERQWAEAACTHNPVAETILAVDFQGTAPDGKRYSKAEEIEDNKTSKI